MIERNGVPEVALVSTNDLERLAELAREREERRQLLARLRAPFAPMSPEEIERDVAVVIAEVRAEITADAESAAAER